MLTRKLAVDLANGEKRLIGISTHITDLAARERRLVQLKVYSHSVAHDLKNPIASIISGANIIERDKATTLGERGRMVLNALRDSAIGLSNSITAMLKAAANEAHDLSFAPYD